VFAEAQQAMRTALEKGKVWRGETSGRRKDGLYYDVALTVAPIRDADGNLAGYVSSHQDISQRKELERARSQFMTNVSHELRTPVSNVKIYTHLLQRGQRAEKAKHYFQVLVEQTGLLEALIQDILEITSLDSGQVLVAWESVSLSTVVADAVKRYQKRAEASGLTLEVMPIPTDLPVVRGDASRLLQALSEVVENAVTFTPSGGRVAIEAEVVEEEGECWVTIAVRDTGPGISQEEQERVFDRFFRGSLAESGHIPGTGLGLSIVQEILQAHGGRVTVESPPLPSTSLRTGTGGTEGGPGSIFTLWLRGVPSGGSE
jgi:two-component system phosphate regulon sensor histidine kinase PhoR